jgi:RluA family pseudouridine synthase
MPEMFRFRVGALEAGLRLDQFLARRAPGLSRTLVRRLIDQGAAYVERRRLKRASYPVKEGEVVKLCPPSASERPETGQADLRILYEDAQLMVLDKPPGVAVQARRQGDVGTLEWAVRRRLREAGQQRPYVAVVHRLDLPASGLVVLALSPEAARGLSRAFAAHEPRRKYLAVVRGRLSGELMRVALPLRSQGTGVVVDPQRGLPAVTRICLLECTGSFSLVEAELETGRTHQIRAHLAAIGHPVVGDRRYGDRESARAEGEARRGRLALHAAELAFEHPVTREHLCFSSPLPHELEALLTEPSGTGRKQPT